MPKVAYLINDLDTGGAEVFLERLLSEFSGKGFDPVVISLLPSGAVGRRMASQGVKVVCLSRGGFAGFFGVLPAIVKVLKEEKPDILNCSLFHSVIMGRIAGRICGVKKIISVFHSDNLGSAFRRAFLRATKGLSDCDVAVSRNIAGNLERSGVSDPRKIKIINLGADIPAVAGGDIEKSRESFGIADGELIITALGRLHKAKGYPVLVDAAKILASKYSNLKFWIMGEGELRTEIESKIRAAELEGTVELLGFDPDPNRRLQVSDIYVLPSLWEGFPNALVEAMACGLPPVAAKVSGAVEVIQDGCNGFLSEVGDPGDLADKLEKMVLIGREGRRKIGSAARKTVEENYSVARMVREYEKIYNEKI